jgi:hypothetical protein
MYYFFVWPAGRPQHGKLVKSDHEKSAVSTVAQTRPEVEWWCVQMIPGTIKGWVVKQGQLQLQGEFHG